MAESEGAAKTVERAEEVVLAEGSGDGTYYVVLQEGEQGGEGVEYVNLGDGQETIVLTEEQLSNYASGGGAVQVLEAGGDGGQVYAQNEDGSYEVVQLVEAGGDSEAGEPSDRAEEEVSMVEPIPQGMKMRRNRVFGHCRCPECGQTFINSARLERHLAVHQVFGSYLCPLCGKTFKYEYNLFYHWRRSCRDLNELMAVEERKTMDINSLRQLVDEVAAKKAELGTLEPGLRRLSGRVEPTSEPPPPRTELPEARRGEPCPECGVVVLASHLDRHLAIHRGETPVDTRGVGGGFYCDLCGLMFRQHFNLIKHWRSSCPEIMFHINPRKEITMDEEELKELVGSLLKKKREETTEGDAQLSQRKERKVAEIMALREESAKDGEDVEGVAPTLHEDEEEEEVEDLGVPPQLTPSAKADVRVPKESDPRKDGRNEQDIDVVTAEGAVGEETVVVESGELEEGWPELESAAGPSGGGRAEEEFVYADEGLYDVGEDGGEYDEEVGPLGLKTTTTRAKWSMVGGPVRCPECFRSFANTGRLERHLAGFHASYGTHHCTLCGNRFKYDYNLLYHYRRSCPYTKAFIDRDVREQMDAPSLRKLVRNLAQKEVRLTPQVEPPARLPGREPPKPRLGNRYQGTGPPAHLLNPRPGLPDGKTCPVCGFIFYGLSAIRNHMMLKHPMEWEEWEAVGGPENCDIQYQDEHGNQIHLTEAAEEDAATEHQIIVGPDGVQYLAEVGPNDVDNLADGPDGHSTIILQTAPVQVAASSSSSAPTTRTRGQRRIVEAPAPSPAPAKPAKRGAIDPGLESSVATFLTEMRGDTDGEAPSSSKQRLRSKRGREAVSESIELDEDLDVTGGDASPPKTAPEPSNLISSKLPPPKRARTRSGLGEQPTCEECGKTFVTNAHLTKHKKTHADDGPATCKLCHVQLRDAATLTAHWRSSSCARLKAAVNNKSVVSGLDPAGLEQLVDSVAADMEIVIESVAPPPPTPRRSQRRKQMITEDVD